MSRPLAETVVTELAAAGVDTMFGVPGGGPNLEKVGAAAGLGIRFVLAHSETAACIMAGAYGLLTGQVGVAIATRGPGVASAVNGVAQATLDRAPLLFVSDTVPAAEASRVPHQRIDQVALLTPVTKWSGTLGRVGAAATTRDALRLAATAPAGAVHLDFDATSAGGPPPPRPDPPRPPGPGELEAAAALAEGARRPLFLLGAEAIPWTGEVRAAVARADAPALTTYQAKGLVPDSGPHAAGLFTNGALERPLLDRADLLVAVGLDPVEPIPAPWDHAAPVLAIHPWEIDDPYFEPAASLIGPVGPLLGRLPPFRSEWGKGAGRKAKERARAALAAEAAGLTPHQVVAAAAELMPDGVVATVDAGAHFLVIMPLWDADEPRRLLISNGLATMGYSLPAAIGAALAHPGRPVVAFVGDGGLGMTLAELETMVRLDLDVTVVVFDDAALSLIAIKQSARHGGPDAVRYAPIDFAAVAASMGMPAARAATEAELRAALGGARRGPRLVDARVDPTVYPTVMRATRG